jgi:DNA-binding NarL/FixJ family response regulator
MGLAASLNEEPDLRVIAEAGSLREAREALARELPDVAILDLRLPDGSGTALAEEIASSHPTVRCLILSVAAGEHEILEAVNAGVCGYLPKSVERPELLEAIRTIAAGGEYFPAAIRRKLESGGARIPLSERELDVLRQMVAGRLNKEIAADLGLAEITVKQHVSAVLRKLGVQDRTQAAIAAVGRGIIQLEE